MRASVLKADTLGWILVVCLFLLCNSAAAPMSDNGSFVWFIPKLSLSRWAKIPFDIKFRCHARNSLGISLIADEETFIKWQTPTITALWCSSCVSSRSCFQIKLGSKDLNLGVLVLLFYSRRTSRCQTGIAVIGILQASPCCLSWCRSLFVCIAVHFVFRLLSHVYKVKVI